MSAIWCLYISAAAAFGWMVIKCWRYVQLYRGTAGKCHCTTLMNGKTVVVTGATSGIGKETALSLARRGARIILACRNLTRAHKVAEEIRSKAGHHNVAVRHLDVSDLDSVRRFAAEVAAEEPRLDVLINNAGIPEAGNERSPQGFHLVMATNHFGPFLLTNLLSDLLKKSAPSRIVTLTSIAHFDCKSLPLRDLNHFPAEDSVWSPYTRSKLCNILFTKELSERLRGTGVTANCVHPGVVNTSIFRSVNHWSFKLFISPLVSLIGKTVEGGAQPVLHLAVSESLETVSGKYFVDFKEGKCSRLARDPDLGKKLWEVTATSVGWS